MMCSELAFFPFLVFFLFFFFLFFKDRRFVGGWEHYGGKKKRYFMAQTVVMRTAHSSPAQRCMWLSTPINKHVKIIRNRFTLLINLDSTVRWILVHKVPPHVNEDMHEDILLLVVNLSFICPKLMREHRRCPRNTRKTWHTVRLPQNTRFHVWPQVVILEVHVSDQSCWSLLHWSSFTSSFSEAWRVCV